MNVKQSNPCAGASAPKIFLHDDTPVSVDASSVLCTRMHQTPNEIFFL